MKVQTSVPPYGKKNGGIRHDNHLMIQMPESDKSKNYRLVLCLLSKKLHQTLGDSLCKSHLSTAQQIFSYSKVHRMVWVGKDLKDYLVPTALPQDGQRHLPLDQVTQCLFQGRSTIFWGVCSNASAPSLQYFK